MIKVTLGYILLNILLVSCSPTMIPSNSISLTERKTNNDRKDYHKIAIVGTSSMHTQLFLDNLSEKLMSDFKKNNIDVSYYFQEDDAGNRDDFWKEISKKEKFDALLIFTESGRSRLTQESQMSTTNTRIGTIRIPSRNIELAASIYIELYESSDDKNSVWEASLNINSGLKNKQVYSKLSRDIMGYLKKSNVLP